MKSLRLHFIIVGIFSSAINLLYLSSPLYLMQVYNRVLISESIPTLALLTLILVIALLVMAALDAARAQILIRCGIILDQKLSGRLFSALVQKSSRQGYSLGAQPLRELDEFRTFITGPGIYFAFDIPWIPIYLGLLYLIHPVLGIVATIGAAVLMGLAFLNEFLTRRPIEDAQNSARRAFTFTENIMQHADVIRAMGMQSSVESHWQGNRAGMLRRQAFASDRNAFLSAGIRFARLLLQSLMLGAGAWLALDHAIMPATIFAASIIMGRALVPVEQSVAAWKQAVTARMGYRRVRDILKENPVTDLKTVVPIKQTALEVKELSYQALGRKKPILDNVSFKIGEGEVLGVVGPSGSGKSTLAKLLIGALQPTNGEIFFGGLNYVHWDPTEFGRITGYLPQDVGLFAGTVRQNIARFGDPSVEEIIQATTLAGIHEMVLSLPKQYDTVLGPGGLGLSGGQRQRIGLARALLGRPKLLVLDEPNAHLDIVGEKALSEALFVMKAQGTAVVVITHQPAILRVVDTVLTLKGGAIDKLGPPESFGSKLFEEAQA
ncbi:type I secretion system permease/ATPase [Nitratireductor sp. ZSWI3]|uniref:type I secretion system permease/ATPase n=1 Tax=Nitratireductor sp. ZSWI3 TaxID=2966359 RepID=UPI002150408F|nr:type I secretion system permease/ATPase [Nitratireductor sp. ZSWI3]MCR4265863.1 type I secretion system permease/ATPase [Nitratireductor sp. ZSWI3]